jgi:hypothetical protein
MNRFILRTVAVTACCGAWCFLCVVASAQVRGKGGVSLSTPSGLRTVGQGGSYSFRQGSAGGGGLQGSSKYRSNGVLRSSMSAASAGGSGLRASISSRSAGNKALRSGIGLTKGGLIGTAGASGGAVGAPVSPASLTSLRKGAALKYQGAAGLSLAPSTGGGMASTILGRSTSLAAARGFIAAIGHSGSLDGPDESVTTLVPDRPGLYRDKMHKGEEQLKANSFMSAYDNFKLASDMVGRFPEPYLNMAHAKFGMNGYGMTAYYIRRAFVCMPSLPQVPLRPKGFYSNVAIFADMVMRLETYLDSNPDDGDALLILAYFRWFTDNPDVPALRSLLERALGAAKSEGRVEAIQIFWRAIVDSKKASGELKVPVKPEKAPDESSTSRPGSSEPESPAKPPAAPDLDAASSK